MDRNNSSPIKQSRNLKFTWTTGKLLFIILYHSSFKHAAQFQKRAFPEITLIFQQESNYYLLEYI